MTLKGELLQWPLLQLVLVHEIPNGQVLETLLVANCLTKILKHCVYNSRRRAFEAHNVDILREFFLLSDPVRDSICGILYEAPVDLYLVQLDSPPVDVLGARREEFRLVGQAGERDVVDGETKCVCHNIIENCNLPLGLAVLHFEWKNPLLRKFFAVKIV